MKLTKRKLSILTLAVVLLLSLAVFFGINAVKTADAITVDKNNVFTATGSATVAGASVGEGENAKYYTTFTLTSDDDVISYRRNLAYSWYENETTGEGENAVTKPVHGQFGMEIGLKNLSFEKFVITFESQQYNKTKDGKTKNYIMFFPSTTEGSVYAVITSDAEYELKDTDKTKVLNAGDIYIEFNGKYTEDYTGGYNVVVRDSNNVSVSGKLENVGGNYAKYSSSSTTPVYPLIFTAEFKEDAENKKAEMILFELNGQKFETTGATSNNVTDTRAPVLCLENELRYLTLNGKLDIDYVVIDVLYNSTPSPTVYYYLLTYDQYKNETDYDKKDLFKETKSADDVLLVADKSKYMPSSSDLENTVYGASYVDKDGKLVVNDDKDKPVADMLAKVYLKIKDSSSSDIESEVFLNWYVEDEYVVEVNDSKFLAVAKDERGVKYNYDGIKLEDGSTKEWGDTETPGTILGDYQAEIDKLAKDLSAGSSSYLYLPSPESLFAVNETAYSDLKFSIYYYHDSKQSSTNLSSSNLSINITKDAPYTFTIYATDAAGNDMYYLDNGEVKEFKTGDIWTMFDDKDNEGLRDRLPWFTFKVGYKGVEFEETPGMQATAYVGTRYTSASFKINGISGSYTTNYRLFKFDSASYYEKNNKATFSYQQFIDNMDELFKNSREYFEEILQVSEGDADYEKYKDYEWSNTSTSFTPQGTDSFYYIRAEVQDKQNLTAPVTCSLAVAATENAKTLKGENNWVENNVASIVLLSIAGASLIGIVLLFVIKPRERGDVDEQLEKAQSKKKSK